MSEHCVTRVPLTLPAPGLLELVCGLPGTPPPPPPEPPPGGTATLQFYVDEVTQPEQYLIDMTRPQEQRRGGGAAFAPGNYLLTLSASVANTGVAHRGNPFDDFGTQVNAINPVEIYGWLSLNATSAFPLEPLRSILLPNTMIAFGWNAWETLPQRINISGANPLRLEVSLPNQIVGVRHPALLASSFLATRTAQLRWRQINP